MKKSLIEQLRNRLGIYRFRVYLDAGSSEFNEKTFDEKIQMFAKIIWLGYDLKEVIWEYKEIYSAEGYRHVYNNVIPTLKEYLSYMDNRTIYNPLVLRPLDNKTDDDVIALFVKTIKEKILLEE